MADQRKFIQTQKFQLAGSGISATDTSIILKSFKTPNDETITMSDLGSVAYGTLGPGTSREEIISFTGVTQNGDGTATLTGVTRGLDFRAPYTQDTALRKSHSGNEVFIITNNPQFYDSFANKENDETIAGLYTFSQVPSTTGGDPVSSGDLARKSYVDSVAGGIATTVKNVAPGTAGETLAAGNLVYLKQADGYWWKCDADTAATVDNILLGIAQGAGTAGNSITNGVLLAGLDTNQSGMTIGAVMYASNTAGAISSTPGTTEVTVGTARSATDLYFSPRYNQQLTEDQQDALDGTSGIPSASNRYVTNDDTSSTPSGNKAIRWNSGAYPAGDGSAITGLTPSIQAGENVVAGDLLKLVNDSGNARLRKLIGLPSSTSTASGGTLGGEIMSVWLSSNLCIFAWVISGTGVGFVAGTLSGGTWTFGSATNVNPTAGVFWGDFGLTRVSDTSFAITLRSATNGGAGNYLYGVACTVSGTTITTGSVTSLDTNANTGDNAARSMRLFTLPSTSTCVCVYRWQDSNSATRSVAFTVSGTTITGGTAVSADTTETFDSVTGCPLGSAKFVIAFSGNSNRKIRVATLSGTTISYGTLTNVTFTSTNFTAVQLATDAFALIGKDISTTTMLQRMYTVSTTTPTEGTLYTYTSSMITGTSEDFSATIIGNIVYVVSSNGTATFYKYRYDSTNNTLIPIASYGSISTTNAINSKYAVNIYGADRLLVTTPNSNNIVNIVGLPDWDEFITSSNGSISSGNNVTVTKMFTGFSSLIPGAKYYAKTDMTTQGVTTNSTYQYIGRAVSSTTIYNDN